MTWKRPLPFIAVIGSVAVLILTLLTCLPHNRYVRFQQTAQESNQLLRIKWIYERIHFDSTPIDIAFIGTSHTQSSIDAELVEAALRESGRYQHVVNFAVPWLGRDLHYLVVRELIESRRINTLVVELQEQEPRAPHPAFLSLGEVGDIISAPVIINFNYLDNLVRLPLRQTSLFLHSEFSWLFGISTGFDAGNYEGQYWNDTYRAHGFKDTRTSVYSAEHFEKSITKLKESMESKQALAQRLTLPYMNHSLSNRYNMLYLEKLLDLARLHGVQIVFYYIPFFTGPKQPVDQAVFAAYGSILTPEVLIEDASLWQNEDHMNVFGARKASRWIGKKLAEIN